MTQEWAIPRQGIPCIKENPMRKDLITPSKLSEEPLMRYALVAVVCSLGLGANPAFADETVNVQIKRLSAWLGKLAPIDVYINDKLVGSVRNDDTKSFHFTGAKLGKNEVRAVEDSVLGRYTYYQNSIDKIGDKKYFLVTKPGEDIVITIGWNPDNLKNNTFSVTNEVPADWAPPPVLRVTVDTELKAIVTKKSPPIHVKDNLGKIVEDTIRVKHSASISESWQAESGVKASVALGWFSIGGEVKHEIQRATSTTYEVERERKRSVTVTDRPAEYVRVVWVNYYRTGTVTTKVNGSEVTVPYMFWDDFDLLLESAKPER
jgi:hypothetical protein